MASRDRYRAALASFAAQADFLDRTIAHLTKSLKYQSTGADDNHVLDAIKGYVHRYNRKITQAERELWGEPDDD